MKKKDSEGMIFYFIQAIKLILDLYEVCRSGKKSSRQR